MVEAKRVTQTIFYFSHEQVRQALEQFLESDSNMPRDGLKPRISAGLHPNSGLTLCYQTSKDLTP
jgi:hypothetical protein